ncbi:alpha/beta hydrolase [Corticibacterium sp. UT-5YL-CI-8]|nr:alpha/beta hydrolase [Tianweitania sp. UT-5YL-CI-8]
MRRAVLLSLCVFLVACASRPIGVLQPTDLPLGGASTVEMLVATTRAPSTDKAILFTGERGADLSMADVTISVPPAANRAVGQIQWPKKLPADPSREFATVAVSPVVGKKQAQDWLGRNLPENRSVLIFVHGFNNRFEDAVYRFAQIVHDSGAKTAPILFTWPSRARIFDYLYDRESTNYSRDALEDLIRHVAEDRRVGEITIMAHSMGAWPTMEALRQMSIRDGRVNPKVKNVILASPDLDIDVFMTQWRSLGEHHPQTYLFSSRRDRALNFSHTIAGGVTRLGQIDPTIEPYKSGLERAGITVFDMTNVEGGSDRLNHGQFAQNPEIVQIIGNRLIAGQTVTDNDPSLGERVGGLALGVGQTVGSAAGLVITAPIAVLDPESRRRYGDQVILFGQQGKSPAN